MRCGANSETGLHVLNGCTTRMPSYTKRHNAVLDVLRKYLLKRSRCVSFDRPLRGELCENTLRPDIVLYDDGARKATIVDVKCPYNNRMLYETNKRNVSKYSCFGRLLRKKDWSAPVFTFTCSSSGLIPDYSLVALKQLGFSRVDIPKILREVVKVCIMASSRIS